MRLPAWLFDAFLIVLAGVDTWLNLDDHTPWVVALSALACLALAGRRCHPLPVFILTLPAAVFTAFTVAPVAALYTLAVRSRDRWLLAGCAILYAAASATPWPLAGFAEDDPAWTFVDFVYRLATAAAPVLLGQLVQARRDVSRQLTEVEQAREHERVLHAQNVLARERAQLAREMHDVVSHQVTLIAVQAGALRLGATDPSTKDAAGTIRELCVATLDELRHMVTLLRASGGDASELTPQPTLADLRRLIATSGIHARLEGELPSSTAAPAQRAVYRTVQEALTNVRKHAPGATATVRLWHEAGTLGVTVTNTPPTRPALPLPSARHGLIGLRERADNLDGRFDSGPTGDGGYEVRLRLPATGCDI